eukprot:scaffold390079_cov29-Prasinocladus_malaysianus.AAC.1
MKPSQCLRGQTACHRLWGPRSANVHSEWGFPQKCKDAAFCERNRGKAGDVYALSADSVALEGSTLRGVVINEETDPHVELSLQVTMYEGFVRLQLDEPGTGRYQVPDVLTETFQ